MTPTKELASQIGAQATQLCIKSREFLVKVFIGGIPKRTMLEDYQREGADILVCTPGRLWDFMGGKQIILSNI